MHIAFNGWFWDQPHTGSGQYIRRLLHQLRRIAPDLQLTLVLPPHNASPDDVPKNVNIISTTGQKGKLGKVLFEQAIFPSMVGQCGADIAHVPYWAPPLASPAKLVTTVLDVISLVMPEYATGFFNRLYTSLVSAATSGSAHIITISDTSKADIMAHLNIPSEKITTTYLGVDEVFHPRIGAEKDAAVKQKYDLPDQFVLYLGGFDVRKQVNQLLYAYTYVAQSEAIPLVLAGKQPPWGKGVFPDLPAYIEKLGITDVVQWIGYVDEADKPSLYRLADVFVYPSVYEGFGLPPIEAMASGTPVVANSVDVMKEITGNGAYLVETPRAMGGAIIALLIQEPLRASMINYGLAQATKYTWRKTAQKTLEVYKQVLSQ
ncbi:MAG: hypothetical protein CUN56_08710 [Phototrophicales bacterium]|nr:MAG: hypothetical protein CUN56_08710 [Phototrophicales bacterium]